MKKIPAEDQPLAESACPRSRITVKKDGKVATILSDTAYRREGDNWVLKYDTTVNGRVFHVTSVLPVLPTSTPTQKIRSLIDLSMDKGPERLDFYQPTRYNEYTVSACPEKEETL